MLKTFISILKDNWRWRKQLLSLAKTELTKKHRDAVLGWTWFFVKPLMYIGVFWFALDLGLRAGTDTGDYPYIVWLASGLLPWFFIQEQLGGGTNVYGKYSYLVNKIKFPIPAISSFYALSSFVIHIALIMGFLIVCLLAGYRFSLYLLQLPLVMLAMYIFWVCWSMFASPLSALSRDFVELIGACTTPLFWLSGIIFNIQGINIAWIQTILYFNPIATFASAYRAAVCEHYWIWENQAVFLPFVLVFVLLVLLAIWNQKTIAKDVADAL